MITLLLTGLLASSILSSNIPATQNAAPYSSFTPVLAQSEFSDYVVQDGEYLSMIAQAFYGSEDYWTNIWNDNPELSDAAQLEPGMILKIRKTKTALPEELNSELVEKTVPQVPVYTYSAATATASVQAQPTVVAPTAVHPTLNQGTSNAPRVLSEEQITYLGTCEAGMNPARNSGNGYYGAFQFSPATWRSMGTGYDRADLAPIEVQKDAVQRLVARSSIFTQFPGCSRKMRGAGLI